MNKILILFFIVMVVFGCAKPRPDKNLPYNRFRIDKSLISSGKYFFGETIVKADYKSEKIIGMDSNYNISSRIVYLRFTENHLNIVKSTIVGEKYKGKNDNLNETVISRYKAKHVDIVRIKDQNDEDTNVFEENTERPWYERTHVVVDLENEEVVDRNVEIEGWGTVAHPFKQAVSEGEVESFKISKEYISLVSKKRFSSQNQTDSVTLKYSFMPVKETDYSKKIYPESLRDKVGFFNTKVPYFDKRGNMKHEYYINRFNPKKRITYYLSTSWNHGDGNKYKYLAYEAIAKWNKVFKKATGIDNYIILKESDGTQALGDLRYNIIHWIGEISEASILGYGPSAVNPYTGEIINANVVIYADNLKKDIDRSIEYERNIAENRDGAYEKLKLVTNGLDEEKSHKPLKEQMKLLAKSVGAHYFDFVKPKVNIDGETDEETPSIVKIDAAEKKLQGGRFSLQNNILDELFSSIDLNKNMSEYLKSDFVDYNKATNITKILNGGGTVEAIFEESLLMLILHELGHTFNLRHNFKASVDKKHFAINEKTGKEMRLTSVMDYSNDFEHLLDAPGPYDEKAIVLSYSDIDLDTVKDIPFLYCTDQHKRIDPMCNAHDIGTTAVEIVDFYAHEYEQYYWLRNHKIKDVKRFYSRKRILNHYYSIFLRTALPIRLFLDYKFKRQKEIVESGVDFEKYMESDEYKDLSQAAFHSMKFLFSMLYTDKSDEDIITRDNELIQLGVTIDRLVALQALNLTSLSQLGLDQYSIETSYAKLLLELKVPPNIFTKLLAKGAGENVNIFDYYDGNIDRRVDLPKGMGIVIAKSLLNHGDGAVQVEAIGAGKIKISPVNENEPYWKMVLLKKKRFELLNKLSESFEYVILFEQKMISVKELEESIKEISEGEVGQSDQNLLKKVKKYESLKKRVGYKDEYELAREEFAASEIIDHMRSEIVMDSLGQTKIASGLIEDVKEYEIALNKRISEMKKNTECWGCPSSEEEIKKMKLSLRLLKEYKKVEKDIEKHQIDLNKYYNRTQRTVLSDRKREKLISIENGSYLAKSIFYSVSAANMRVDSNRDHLQQKTHEYNMIKRVDIESNNVGDSEKERENILKALDKLGNDLEVLKYNKEYFEYNSERELSTVYKYIKFFRKQLPLDDSDGVLSVLDKMNINIGLIRDKEDGVLEVLNKLKSDVLKLKQKSEMKNE